MLTTLIPQSPPAWTTIGPLPTREAWTCLEGMVVVTTEPVIDDAQGVMLVPGQSRDFRAGTTLYVRASGGSARAVLNRESALVSEVTLPDRLVTGTPGLSALSTDLLSGQVGGFLDVSAYSTAIVQLVGSAGISAGAVFFEQSVDGVNWSPAVAAESGVINSNPVVAAITIAASTARQFIVMLAAPYLRARVSTAFAGGTIQAFAYLRRATVDFPVVNVQQATAASLAVTATMAVTTLSNILSSAGTNGASVKASAANLQTVVVTNYAAAARFVKIYNKGSAPTVGTDLPIATLQVPANTTQVFGFGNPGLRLGTGYALAITGGVAETDTTAIAAGDVRVASCYT